MARRKPVHSRHINGIGPVFYLLAHSNISSRICLLSTYFWRDNANLPSWFLPLFLSLYVCLWICKSSPFTPWSTRVRSVQVCNNIWHKFQTWQVLTGLYYGVWFWVWLLTYAVCIITIGPNKWLDLLYCSPEMHTILFSPRTWIEILRDMNVCHARIRQYSLSRRIWSLLFEVLQTWMMSLSWAQQVSTLLQNSVKLNVFFVIALQHGHPV